MSMIATQDSYMAELARCSNVTRCYGNKKRAIAAAWKRHVAELIGRGYSEADAQQVLRDAQAVYDHNRMCDDADDE